MARATRRPIRPKPLIATLVAMILISLKCFQVRHLRLTARKTRQTLAFQRRDDVRHDRFGGEAEAFEQIASGRGGAEPVEADIEAVTAGVALPAEGRSGLDRDEQ